MSSVSTSSAAENGLKIWSCVNCRRRKLRCERREPCSNCVRSKIECHFPVTGRLPRRSRDPSAAKPPAEKQKELLGRLRRLEALVTELASQMEDGTVQQDGNAVIWKSPNSRNDLSGPEASIRRLRNENSTVWQNDEDPTEDFGDLVTETSGSLRVARGFWSIFCNEVDNIFEAVSDAADSLAESVVDDAIEPPLPSVGAFPLHKIDAHSFLLSNLRNEPNQAGPDLSQLRYLWKVFCTRVEPFIQILDVSSVARMIEQVAQNGHEPLPLSEHPLLNAIALAAVVSLDEEEVQATFSRSKSDLLNSLVSSTCYSLSQAKFMTSKKLATLQAFMIYVFFMPHIGQGQETQPMTGLLVQLAFSLNLQHDPLTLKNSKRHPAFSIQECAVRRRLWWNLCFLDARVRNRSVPFFGVNSSMFTTELPEHLVASPHHEKSPDDCLSITARNTLLMIRCELWSLSQALQGGQSRTLAEQQMLVDVSRSRIETSHMVQLNRHDDFQSFVFSLTTMLLLQLDMAICRRALNNETTENQRITLDKVLECCTRILELSTELRCRPKWKLWRWQMIGDRPWQALIVVLRLLRWRKWDDQGRRAWFAAEGAMRAMPSHSKYERLHQIMVKSMAVMRSHLESNGLVSEEQPRHDRVKPMPSSTPEESIWQFDPSADMTEPNSIAGGCRGCGEEPCVLFQQEYSNTPSLYDAPFLATHPKDFGDILFEVELSMDDAGGWEGWNEEDMCQYLDMTMT